MQGLTRGMAAAAGLSLALWLLTAGCSKAPRRVQGVTYTAPAPNEQAMQPAALATTPAAPPAGPAAAPAGADWPLYGQNYNAWRYSPLTQINKSNVAKLKVAWSVSTGMHDAFEATPIVTGGTMYVTTPWNHVLALDPATGAQKWRFVWPLPKSLPLCCGAVNRGACVGSGKVVFGTLDAHLVGLDAATGKQAWAIEAGDYKQGYSITMAPQIVGNKVIVGMSGGDFGVRGYVDAYNVANGAHIWRFYTVGPGNEYKNSWGGDSWQHGGGPVWMTPTYERPTNTLFIGVGNPGPDLDGSNRPGDNLYTECTIALDADTARLKWYYQTVPHDVWDLDNVVEPVLDDVAIDGTLQKVVMWAGKNGYFYCLDRATGKFIYALPYAHEINWGHVDSKGRPHPDLSKYPVKGSYTRVAPGASGGKEWVPVAYDPKRKMMFVPVIELPHLHQVIPQDFRPGQPYWGGVSATQPAAGYGHVTAIDVSRKRVAWDTRTAFPVVSGVLCTASGLVIVGTPDQQMLVLDADTGRILWQFRALSGFHGGPISYAVGGKQYIAYPNGWGGWVAGFNGIGTPRLKDIPKDNTLYVFSLP